MTSIIKSFFLCMITKAANLRSKKKGVPASAVNCKHDDMFMFLSSSAIGNRIRQPSATPSVQLHLTITTGFIHQSDPEQPWDSEHHVMSSPTSKTRQRNGRLAACVPCRARKVACDHTRPVCNRCRKRKQHNACRYPEGPSSPAPASRSESASEQVTEESFAHSPEPSGPTACLQGYFGYPSHNDVFGAAESYLALLGDQGAEKPALIRGKRSSFRDLPLPLRDTALLTLRCLPGQADEQIRFHDSPDEPKGWTYMAIDRIIASLQTTFKALMERGDSGLEMMADVLSRNSAKPFLHDIADPQQWIGQMCERNLRWESIGLLWVHSVKVSDVLDSLRNRNIEWLEMDVTCAMEAAAQHLSYCIELARHLNNGGNDILLDLCKRRSTLQSMLDGDAAISTYTSHGVTVAMLTYMGCHDIQDSPDYKPTLASEYRRRQIAQIFSSDKIGVTFTGRPPLISRRYCSTPLPLDLADEDLAADEVTLIRAVNSLDRQGWNTKGEVYSATVMRARVLFAILRDELIELGLGRGIFVTIQHLMDIKVRARALLPSLPNSLVYRPENFEDSQMDTARLYIQIVVYLDHLQNLFFTERLLLRHGQVDEGDLLVTSFELVSLTIKLWTNKDRFSDPTMVRNFEWLLMGYGAPGGGILCQELLEPTFSGSHPKNPKLTRSSIVQQLSLLVGFLDWVRPSQPNGELCADAKAIIQRVLDHHLNGPAQGEALDVMSWGVMAQPDFNFELLDTFDWLRTDGQGGVVG